MFSFYNFSTTTTILLEIQVDRCIRKLRYKISTYQDVILTLVPSISFILAFRILYHLERSLLNLYQKVVCLIKVLDYALTTRLTSILAFIADIIGVPNPRSVSNLIFSLMSCFNFNIKFYQAYSLIFQ